ncbi:hypothetical protein EMN47_07435 [Prolixibacteraceae bacterium JC049]|nr:hypothetical protein [Prolixibacteraceae bacterium JC049]
MNKIELLKRISPYCVAVLLFVVLSFAYFTPLLEGKRLQQTDGTTFRGMSKEVVDYRNETGEEALWTDALFGGMPAYLISTKYSGNIVHKLDQVLQTFPRPASFIFLYLIGFYVLMLALRVNKWLSIVGAIAFAFSSYQFIIISAGHNSKAIAIAYMPMIIAGVIMAFRGRRIWGSIIFSIGLALNLLAGHPQITYYTLLTLVVFGIVELIYAIKEKTVVEVLKSGLVLIIPALIALGTDASRTMVTLEYGKYSMRGKSELTHNKANQTKGIDRDYATSWSYGVDETFNLFIPNYKGGASAVNIGTDSETYKALKAKGHPQARDFAKMAPLYWGPQPSTSGPVYIGAVIIFLFVLSLFVIDKRYKWWVVAGTVMSITLAWGKHFMPLTDFFLDYIPGYNKFRTVSMILVIAEVLLPIAAFLAVQRLVEGKLSKAEWQKALKWSTIITGGFALLVALMPSISGSFTSQADGQMPGWFIEAIRADRQSALRMDALRTFAFVVLTAGAVWAFMVKKLNASRFYIILGVLILVDLWGVNKRYLNDDQFASAKSVYEPFKKELADNEILKDKDISYRVLNLENPFNDPRTCYFHKAIGGFHGAKMRRYQELIEHGIVPEMRAMIPVLSDVLQKKTQAEKLDSALMKTNVLNMLNMRYIIFNPKAPPVKSVYGNGNAWFVKDVDVVDNADQELAALRMINTKERAVVDQRFKDQIKGFKYDGAASIELTEYRPNYLKYSSNSNWDQLAVLSEIYYPKGWQAYIDGKEVEHFRANYVLRAMMIPAGKHVVEFKFEPSTYHTGNKINLISSVLLLLMIGGAVVWELRRRKYEQA